MRKREEGLREALLACARSVAKEQGPGAISIRRVAKGAGIAPGTFYLYFASKEALLLALTEAYWREALAALRALVPGNGPFPEQLENIYAYLRRRMQSPAGELMGSLGNLAGAGRARMQGAQQALRAAVLARMEQDRQIRQDTWDAAFTPAQYADFIVMNLLLYLKLGAADLGFFTELVRRTLYERQAASLSPRDAQK